MSEPARKRRRLRLSCVECTKRRQRCDRQTPCSLCVKRRVPECCLYLDEPFSRPSPKRPASLLTPKASSTTSDGGSSSTDDGKKNTIDALNARIRSLEATISSLKLSSETGADTESSASAAASHGKSKTHGMFELDLLPTGSQPFDYNAFTELTTSFRSNLVDVGGEFLGKPDTLGIYIGKVPQDNDVILASSNLPKREIEPNVPLGALDINFPAIKTLELLFHRFFMEENWRFGIPPDWLLRAYGTLGQVPGVPGARFKTIHCSKLALIFAVIGTTLSGYHRIPEILDVRDSGFYMSCAASARQLAYAARDPDSIEEGCYAVILQCHFLIDRCRVTDAWLILGHALRDAISIGIHEAVSGNHIQNISPDALTRQRRIWHHLAMPDRFYSTAMGRPPMISEKLYQQTVFFNDKLTDLTGQNLYHQCEVKLWSIMIECKAKIFSDGQLNSRAVFDIDRKIDAFNKSLPKFWALERLSDFDNLPLTPPERHICVRQWSTIKRRSLLVRTKLHIINMLHGKSVKTHEEARLAFTRTQSRNISLSVVTDLLEHLREILHASNLYYDDTQREPVGDMVGNNGIFEHSITLFEATTVFIGIMSQLPIEERSTASESLVDASIDCLRIIAERVEESKLARVGYLLLSGLAGRQNWRCSAKPSSTLAQPPVVVPSSQQQSSVDTSPMPNQHDIFSFMDPGVNGVGEAMSMLVAPVYNNLFMPPGVDDAPMMWPFYSPDYSPDSAGAVPPILGPPHGNGIPMTAPERSCEDLGPFSLMPPYGGGFIGRGYP